MGALKRIAVAVAFFAIISPAILAQESPPGVDILEKWKQFASKNWHRIDYSKEVLTRERIDRLDPGTPDDMGTEVSELALLRGVIFGKRGRIFKDRRIQGFLDRQSWYKPDPDYSNSLLGETERDNLDTVRLTEAEKRPWVQPGDLRYWSDKEIPEDKITFATAGEWRIMIAEIEAIHGRRFHSEPWLQRYFEDRYWYSPKSDYSPDTLTSVERSNIELLIDKRNEERKISVWVGDMDKFQNALLTEELLEGLTLSELRLIRNEFFARNGYRFAFPGIAQHFEWREWYVPFADQSKVSLNETEKRNVELIERVEKNMRENLATEAIKPEMIEGLFIEDLRVLRNEIFARRGRVFRDAELQKYFESQSWYKPDPDFKDEVLGKAELDNLAVIREAEEIAMSRFDAFEG